MKMLTLLALTTLSLTQVADGQGVSVTKGVFVTNSVTVNYFDPEILRVAFKQIRDLNKLTYNSKDKGPTVSETILLRYLAPEGIPTVVKNINDIDQLTCNFKDNSITIRGSQKSVNSFKSEVQAADVKPILYRVEMKLVRYHRDKLGKSVETVLMAPIVYDMENYHAASTVTQDQSGYSLLMTPHKDTDKTVWLTVEVQELGEQSEVVRSGKNTRSVKLGETIRITGMTDSSDKALRRAVHQGEIVSNAGEYSGYYVEVKPTIYTSSGTSKL